MTDWSAAFTGILALATELTGVHAEAENGPRSIGLPALLLVSRFGFATIGAPDRRYILGNPDWTWGDVWGGSDEPLIERISVLHGLILRWRAEVLEQDWPTDAKTILDDLRTRLQFHSSHDTLAELGFFWEEALPTIEIDSSLDDRIRSMAVFDLRVRFRNDVSDVAHPRPGIRRVYTRQA